MSTIVEIRENSELVFECSLCKSHEIQTIMNDNEIIDSVECIECSYTDNNIEII